jgi:hypothetical protein
MSVGQMFFGERQKMKSFSPEVYAPVVDGLLLEELRSDVSQGADDAPPERRLPDNPGKTEVAKFQLKKLNVVSLSV